MHVIGRFFLCYNSSSSDAYLKSEYKHTKKCFIYKRHLGVVVIKLASPGQVKQVVTFDKTACVFYLAWYEIILLISVASLSLAEMPLTGLLGGLTWRSLGRGVLMLLALENPNIKRTANLVRRRGSQG